MRLCMTVHPKKHVPMDLLASDVPEQAANVTTLTGWQAQLL